MQNRRSRRSPTGWLPTRRSRRRSRKQASSRSAARSTSRTASALRRRRKRPPRVRSPPLKGWGLAALPPATRRPAYRQTAHPPQKRSRQNRANSDPKVSPGGPPPLSRRARSAEESARNHAPGYLPGMTPLLVHRAKSVDRAFERLYKRHVHDVYRYTLAVLHNDADAEDVTQAAFLSAYRAFRKGERPVKPHNWLIKIAHNECRQRFRASARRPQEVTLQETDGHPAGNPADDVPTAEELRHALAQLSFNQRAALVMRELEGRTYAEIAAVLETSVSAVETLLFRARRALREQLEGSIGCDEFEALLSRQLDGELNGAD